jgi:hypothetical protein
LETVLSDDPLRKELAVRSRQAQEKYFSWAAIVERFGAALGTNSTEKESDLTKKSTNAIRVA